MANSRINEIRILIIRVILVAIAIIFVALPVAAWQWSQNPFPGLLFDPNLVVSDSGTNESRWPGKQVDPPIIYPEHLISIDGKPLINITEYNAILAEHDVGDVLAFSFVQPANSTSAPLREGIPLERTVDLELIYADWSDIWNQFGLFYVTGLIVFIIATWTFWMRPDQEVAQLFALFAGLGGLAAAAVFDGTSTQYFIRIWVLCVSIFGGFNLILATQFPHPSRLIVRFPWLKALILVPSFVIAIWGQIELYSTTDPWAYVVSWRAAYFINGLYLIGSLGVLGWRAFLSRSPIVRQQARLIMFGALFGFLPLIIFFVLISMDLRPLWLTNTLYLPPVVIYPLVFGYTIVRYRLLEVNVVLRRGATYAILIAALMVTFSSVAYILQPVLKIENPVVLAIIIVMLALIFDPLRNRLQKGIDQYIFRQPIELDILARTYNRELATAVTINEVIDKLLNYVKEGIPDAEATTFLPDAMLDAYESYTHPETIVDTKSPIISILQSERVAIDLSINHAWPDELQAYRQDIEALNAAVIVPINGQDGLLGWLSMSPKHSGQRYRQAELNFLIGMADQTLLALERANVVRRLEARISELDLLSQFSQYLNFTTDQDMLLELVYTNYQRLLGIRDLFIHVQQPGTGLIYPIFYVKDDERYEHKEGENKPIDDQRVQDILEKGQTISGEDENGRFWIGTTLYAGATTIGTIHTFLQEQGVHLRPQQEKLFEVFADRTAVALERLRANQQIESRANQLEKINQVSYTLASTLEVNPLLQLVLDNAIELLGAEAGTFMLTIEDTGELEFAVVRGPASDNLLGTRLPVGTGVAGSVAQTGRPTIINRAHEDKRWFAQMDASTEFHTESLLTVPLLRQNTVRGVIQVINKRNGALFNEEDERLLMTFAAQAVLALENARLLEQTDQELQDRVNELFMLQQLDRDLNTTLELDTVLRLTLEWALRILKGTAGAIALINGDDHQLQIRGLRGYSNRFDPADIVSGDTPGGLIGLVAQTGSPHITGNVDEEPAYVMGAFATRSQMTLPIIYKQQMAGVIAIESDQPNAFDENDLETATRLTTHAAVAIANAQLYEQVNEANRAKSEFVSMVSHELKTPMTSIKGYTDLMLSGMTGDITPQQQGFLETIIANLNRMSRQIQDLTDISRIETGQLHIEVSPVSFSNIISETLQTVRGPCDSKSIELNLDLPPDLPLIQADQGRLVQVMTNLLSNACKYSPEATAVDLTLHTELISIAENTPPQPMVVCSVKDSGYGISEENVKKLFTKFFRADDPNIRKAPGTGLGLSITKGIIEIHGGKIWAESELGKGTTFSFCIPQAIGE